MFTSEFDREVQAAGGMEEYYKLSQKEALEAHKKALSEIDPSIDPARYQFNSSDYHFAWIKRIKSLFYVYESLNRAGIAISFISLTHAMQDYSMSVLLPMKELIDKGSVDEAVALYNQPRRHHR